MAVVHSMPKNKPRKSLFVSPPLAVFLALKLNSQTRSKKLVELLYKYALGVSYKKVLTIEVNFGQAIADQTRNNVDKVCPTNLRHHMFTVGAQFPSSQKPWLDLEWQPATFIYLVPPVGRTIITHHPVKDVQSVGTNSFDEEKQKVTGMDDDST